MTVTNADKIAAIQSVIDGVPPWADMSAFRAILDDLQKSRFLRQLDNENQRFMREVSDV